MISKFAICLFLAHLVGMSSAVSVKVLNVQAAEADLRIARENEDFYGREVTRLTQHCENLRRELSDKDKIERFVQMVKNGENTLTSSIHEELIPRAQKALIEENLPTISFYTNWYDGVHLSFHAKDNVCKCARANYTPDDYRGLRQPDTVLYKCNHCKQ